MPPAPNNHANTVLVRVRGTAPTHNPSCAIWKHAAWCDVAVIPNKSIEVGQRVVLKKIIGRDENPGEDEPQVDPPNVQDLDIEGDVIRVRAVEKETIEFVVTNRIERSMTEVVYLTVECVLGETVKLTGWNWWSHRLAWFLGTASRRTPAERISVAGRT
ncbi:hypothetical protein C2E23DRAFT_856251 [Lenzites betulinus]|nr:hypothetical protein C2E23DRAFT_856251 [Lenzites betulinus]